MEVCDVIKKIDKANKVWEFFTNNANPPVYAENVVEICEDYVDMLSHLKVKV